MKVSDNELVRTVVTLFRVVVQTVSHDVEQLIIEHPSRDAEEGVLQVRVVRSSCGR